MMDPGFRILNDLELAREHLQRAQVLLARASGDYMDQWVDQTEKELLEATDMADVTADTSELPCYCAETSMRNCPRHCEPASVTAAIESDTIESAITIPVSPFPNGTGWPTITHAFAPPPDGVALHDEPPSRPL